VYDENQLGADEIQEGTHNVSHLYARATKAVSLVPAAYYADLACERGRCYLNEFLVDDKTSVGGKSGKSSREEKDHVFNAARAAWGEGVSPFSCVDSLCF
jgi:eukaryotic translation initiation factor 2C